MKVLNFSARWNQIQSIAHVKCSTKSLLNPTTTLTFKKKKKMCYFY